MQLLPEFIVSNQTNYINGDDIINLLQDKAPQTQNLYAILILY